MIRSKYQQNLSNKKPHIYFCEYYGKWLFSRGYSGCYLPDERNNSLASRFCSYKNNERKKLTDEETTTKNRA